MYHHLGGRKTSRQKVCSSSLQDCKALFSHSPSPPWSQSHKTPTLRLSQSWEHFPEKRGWARSCSCSLGVLRSTIKVTSQPSCIAEEARWSSKTWTAMPCTGLFWVNWKLWGDNDPMGRCRVYGSKMKYCSYCNNHIYISKYLATKQPNSNSFTEYEVFKSRCSSSNYQIQTGVTNSRNKLWDWTKKVQVWEGLMKA